MEALEIKKAILGDNMKLLNRDEENFVSTNTQTPPFAKMIGTNVALKQNQDFRNVK